MISELIYNWFFTNEGQEHNTYTVGKHGVTQIIEHQSKGDGDRWYYDVFFDDGRMERIFNPNKVTFK